MLLSERVERAEGPSRELDKEIALGIGYLAEPADFVAPLVSIPPIPNYTASIDAAMTLVPEGWRLQFLQEIEFTDLPHNWTVELWPRTGTEHTIQVWAVTPALALCAAALKARGL